MNVIGDRNVSMKAWEAMRLRGGDWYAFQNVDMGSAECGDIRFLNCGEGCKLAEPPKRLNWRFYLVGKVNLEKGLIEDIKEGDLK